MTEPASLGIDIGTTSIAAQTVSLETGVTLNTVSFDHGAAITLDGYPDAFAADAEKLVALTCDLIKKAVDEHSGICSIGFSGQMHGIVCLDDEMNALSPLFTWQNSFGERLLHGKTICQHFMDITCENTPTGYGLVTLFALDALGLLPENTSQIATIADLAASRLCGLTHPVLHPTMAASLGLFDIESSNFSSSASKIAKAVRLPEVRDGYCIIGHHTINDKNIPVAAACGDNQIGAFGSLANDDMMLISIGTSSQVSLIGSSGFGCETRPYFDGKLLSSGSGLCGGRAYAALADLVCDTVSVFAPRPSKTDVYDYLNRITETAPKDPLEISTRFCGTREDTSLRGSISGISLESFDIPHIADGILRGIAEELHTMARTMVPQNKKYKIAATGNALRRCPALRRICAETFSDIIAGNELLLPRHTEEPAYGAALYAAISSGLITRPKAQSLIKYL